MAISDNPFQMDNNVQPAPASAPATNPFSTDAATVGVSTPAPVNNEPPKPNFEGGVSMQNQGQGNPFQTPNPNPNPQPGFGPGAQQPRGPAFNPGTNPQHGFGQPAQQTFNPNPTPAPQQTFNPNPTPAPQQTFSNPQGNVFNPNPQPQQGGYPQQNFGNPPQQQNNQQNGQQVKYVIVDFFWLINKKLIYHQQLEQGEAAILTVGYNASFNNLRFSFHGVTNETFTPSSITIQNTQRLAMCNIYSEQALDLLTKSKGTGAPVYSFERVIKSGNWTPNKTIIVWNPDSIIIQTCDSNNNTYKFPCYEDQIYGLEKALEFMINGQAWMTGLMAAMSR